MKSFKKFVFSSNQVEYEIDSGSDEENEKARKDRDGSSAEDSDIEVTFLSELDAQALRLIHFCSLGSSLYDHCKFGILCSFTSDIKLNLIRSKVEVNYT